MENGYFYKVNIANCELRIAPCKFHSESLPKKYNGYILYKVNIANCEFRMAKCPLEYEFDKKMIPPKF